MSYPLLHELLDLVERYEEFRGNAEQSMSNFLRFADQSLEQQKSSEEPKTGIDVYKRQFFISSWMVSTMAS